MGDTKQSTRQSFFLEAVPPFRLDLTVWTLRRRPENAMDRWDDQTYRRVLRLTGVPTEVAVRQVGPADHPRLRVTIPGQPLNRSTQQAATIALEQLLGLNVDLTDFYRLASQDVILGALVRRFRGMKPPRFDTVFECLINAVACQQVSLTVGILLLNRLAESLGPSAKNNPLAHTLPTCEDLAAADPKSIQALGFSRRKAEYIVELARTTGAAKFDPHRLAALSNDEVAAQLTALRGIGRWSAEYALLRGLGRLDVFPADDVGAGNNLRRWLGLSKSLDYLGVRRKLARWSPYAGLVYFHLLLDGIANAGHVAESPPARSVRGQKRSVVAKYASAKNAQVIKGPKKPDVGRKT